MLIHVYFASNKTSNKEEWVITILTAVRTEVFIQQSVAPCQRVPKRHLLSEFPEKI